jgi:4-hydroxy-tetrahydrodipicolinate reductase
MKFCIAGASGRMGRMLIETVLASPGDSLVGALDQAGSPALGQDATAWLGRSSGVAITADLHTGLAGADVLVDFTRPAGTLAHLAACREFGTRAVIGTTGFDDAGKAAIAAAAQDLPIVFAANMSVGVNVTLELLKMAARALASGYDVEIVEAHHKHKVDAPSGTALAMGETIAAAQGKSLKACAVYAREGHTGAREDGSIGFATIRGGDIVGDHTVMFIGAGERIEIAHRSNSRQGYAQGSLRAAHFLAGRGPGLYGMDHVLGLT